MSVIKKIGLVCFSIAIIYPVALLFEVAKPALLITATGLIIKFSSGDIINTFPPRFAVAVAFSVTAVSYMSILYPITTIPGVILLLALCGIFVLIDYRTKGKYEWYSRAVIVPIFFICILWPDAWGVNELFYGFLLQALKLPDWTSRGMELIDEVLIRWSGFVKKMGME